jgi:hypothetical protein
MPEDPRADELAADGDQVPEGVEPPTIGEQLDFLDTHGWPT